MGLIDSSLAKIASRLGLTVSRTRSMQNRLPIEATDVDRRIIEQVRPFTMTSTERIWTLLQAVLYLQENKVHGDFVECGVWRGGSMMAMALKLQSLEAESRVLWLYDTFEGMTPPTSFDTTSVGGKSAEELLRTTPVSDGDNVWCVADQLDVEQNLASTGYPLESLRFVAGDVAQTLMSATPEKIALLRLDTDWYESTLAELEYLYPKLTVGGICILDDYGHWTGARKAVDDFFAQKGARPLLLPVDFSGRIFTKTHE